MIELRPHQVDIVEALRASLRKGYKRTVIQAPCSTGKTAISAFLMQQAALKNRRSVMLCDRVILVEQTIETLIAFGLEGQFSVMMADHELYDPSKLIQVCSTQTAMNRKNSPALAADLFIIDECHVLYKSVQELMRRFDNCVWVGLSATPMSRGLSAPGLFQDLVTTVKTPDLVARGLLTPIEYYAGHQVNLAGVRSISAPTGGSDYNPADLEKALLADKILTGDVIKNFKLHAGEDRQGVAFSSSIAHSKALSDAFNEAGIKCAHMDGYMKLPERNRILEAYRDRELQLLSTAKLLNQGFDMPQCSILLDMAATRSKIQYCQRAGRIQRIYPGKEVATYLDFVSNVSRHGYSEQICAVKLDDGSKAYKETNLIKKDDDPEGEPIMHTCPQCSSLYRYRRCLACGYELPSDAKIYHDDQILEKVKPKEKSKKDWFAELVAFEAEKGYKHGWARFTYNNKFGVFPRESRVPPAKTISDEVRRYIVHLSIKRSRGRNPKPFG